MQRTGRNGREVTAHTVICLFIFLALLSLDIITKKIIWDNQDKLPITIIDNFFKITYSFNTGAGFSFLADVSWGRTFLIVLTSFSLVAFVFLYIWAERKNSKWFRISVVFLLSGTLGNFVDRILYCGVTDFLSFTFWGWNFPIFNVADICICVGAFLLALYLLFIDEHALLTPKKKKTSEKTDEDSNEK